MTFELGGIERRFRKWAGRRSNPRLRCFRPPLDHLSYRPRNATRPGIARDTGPCRGTARTRPSHECSERGSNDCRRRTMSNRRFGNRVGRSFIIESVLRSSDERISSGDDQTRRATDRFAPDSVRRSDSCPASERISAAGSNSLRPIGSDGRFNRATAGRSLRLPRRRAFREPRARRRSQPAPPSDDRGRATGAARR